MSGAGQAVIFVLLTVLDLGGTFAFAISGAVAAVRHRLDIFSVMVLAFAAGNVGGITRDLLISAVPPAAIANWSYLGVSILAGLLVAWSMGAAEPAIRADASGFNSVLVAIAYALPATVVPLCLLRSPLHWSR